VAQSSWPTVAGGHAVSDTQWEQMTPGFAADGIIGTVSDTTVVFGDSTGLQVKLRANKYGLVRGHGWTSGTVDTVLTLAANPSGSTRIDLAVLRFDRTTQAATMVIKAGTPGAGAPALQRDPVTNAAGLYEVAVAQITVGPGATSISPVNVAVLHPYVSGPPIIVVDLATLNLVTPPPYGTLATAANQPYVYTSSGWVRADWNSGWGVIGGHDYTSSGVALAAGLSAGTEYTFNMDAGSITFTAGRRYRVSIHVKYVVNTNNAFPLFHARDNSPSGTVRATFTGWPSLANIGHETVYEGQWSEAAGGTRTVIAAGQVSAGLVSIYRGNADPIGVWIEDLGPSSLVTTI
jgi:hypothetical protein